jgi:hypothetical protein
MKVTSTEQNVGRYQDAAQQAPVAIMRPEEPPGTRQPRTPWMRR